ncbi:hypothetical protein Tco_0510402 [Tanacetum coccineum]
MGDKEVTKQDLVAKVEMEVLGRLLYDMVMRSWRVLEIKTWIRVRIKEEKCVRWHALGACNMCLSSGKKLLRKMEGNGEDGNESHNRNLRAILANGVISCSTPSDQGYAEDFYDQ